MANQDTIGKQFNQLHLIHGGICAFLIVLLAISRYLLKHQETKEISYLTLEIITIGVTFLIVIAARFLFFMRTRPALSAVTLKEKIEIFRAAFHLQMILLGIASLLNILLYITIKNNLNFFIGLGILLLLLFRRPTRVIAAMVLFNSGQDVQAIYNNETPL